eukprot:4757327-Prymnesium_polylepis.3
MSRGAAGCDRTLPSAGTYRSPSAGECESPTGHVGTACRVSTGVLCCERTRTNVALRVASLRCAFGSQHKLLRSIRVTTGLRVRACEL